MLKSIFLAFIPIFVAVDAVGVLPIFASLTTDLDKRQKNKIILESILTASVLAIGFIFLGKAVFGFLGITMGDFMVAGGVILFCIAVIDLLQPGKERRLTFTEIGVVPIATPLMVGPAVLTTSLILIDQYGIPATVIAVLANIILAGVLFIFSHVLIKVLGEAGSKALSKIMALLLAAIAVMLIRKGILLILAL